MDECSIIREYSEIKLQRGFIKHRCKVISLYFSLEPTCWVISKTQGTGFIIESSKNKDVLEKKEAFFMKKLKKLESEDYDEYRY
jgi:cold shock CspA family protein